MRISPSTDTDPNRIENVLPQTGPIVNPLPPATQSNISGILQREQDRVIALLSSNPLFAGLLLSCVNQATALEPASATPSPESEEWKVLQNAIATLRDEIEKLKSENLELTKELESSKAFRSQVSSLEAVNTTQQDDIKSLRMELAEAKENHDRLTVDYNAEKATLQIRVLDLEARQGELKEAIVKQQIAISNLERQYSAGFPDPSTAAVPTKVTCTQGHEVTNPDALMKGREECGGRLREAPAEEWIEMTTRRQVEQEAKEQAGREIQEKSEREAKRRARREARETRKQAERAVKEQAEKVAREQAEWEAKRKAVRARLVERIAKRKAAAEVGGREEREEKEKTEREAKEKRDSIPETPLAWGRDHRGLWIQGETTDSPPQPPSPSPPQKPSGWGSSWGGYLFG